MKSVPERPTSHDTLQDEEAARVPLDPRDFLSPDVVDRLLDVMARLVVNAARVRAERATLEAAATATPAPEPQATTSKPRTRRPSPSRLAKWEAHWQAEAEQSVEGGQ